MKKVIGIISLLLSVTLATANPIDFDKAFKESANIEKQIKRTSFPDRTYLITDFGAKPDTPDEPCHEAINQAIVTCSLNGGGTVVVPKGTFHTGPVTLKSNVNFHVEEGAVLKFSTDQSLYFPAVITRWEGLDCYNARPLIYAYGHYSSPTSPLPVKVQLTDKVPMKPGGLCAALHATAGRKGWLPNATADANVC